MICTICEGLGFVLETRIINHLPYEFMLHCECPAGDKWRYSGMSCKENKSPSFINSVSFRGGEVSLQELPKHWQEKEPRKPMENMTINNILDRMVPEGRPM